MSDDLVKRAREWDFCWPSRDVEMLVPAMADRIEELEKQNASLKAKLEMLIDTLYKSADGWYNVIGMGLIAKKHFESARVLRDEAFDALQSVGVEL